MRHDNFTDIGYFSEVTFGETPQGLARLFCEVPVLKVAVNETRKSRLPLNNAPILVAVPFMQSKP